MSRALQISEDVRRQTGHTMYRCMNNSCQHMELSSDMTPQDVMRGHGPTCSKCGGLTEAVWSGASLPGSISQPISTKVPK